MAPTSYELNGITQYKNQPNILKLKLAQTDNISVKRWIHFSLAQYYANQNKNDEACKHYVHLSNDNYFALKNLATLRALLLCSYNSQHRGLLAKDNINNLQPWLKNLYIDAQLKDATQRGDEFDQMKLYYEVSKRPLKKTEKVKYTTWAKNLADKLKQNRFSDKMQKRIDWLSPKKNSKLALAKKLVHIRQFEQANNTYLSILNNRKAPFMENVNALWGIRKIKKLQLDDEGYVKATENLARYVSTNYNRLRTPRHKQSKRFHDTNITLARTYWTKGRTEDAEKTLKYLSRKLKKKYSLAKVYYLRGRIAEEQRKLEVAVWWYEQSLKQPKITNELYESALWFKAWNQRKLSKYNNATKDFKQLVKIAKDAFDKNRYLYWLAKTLKAKGDHKRANEEFKNLTQNDVLGFYGLLSAREINKNLTHLYLRSTSIEDSTHPSIDLNIANWLLTLGEKKLAADSLYYTAKNLRKSKVKDIKTWNTLFSYYLKTEQYNKMFAELGRLNSDLRHNLLAVNPEIYFPRPFNEIVKKSSEKFGISSSMIFAIMRQESAFDPEARSFAHAMGLMQMLPQVAEYTSKRYSIPYSNTEDLFNPKVSIPLGSAFLKQLFNRYEGQFILAVASYNASEKAIQNWVQTRFTGDPIEFIEDIPYRETRTYVRLVMRNYIYYEVQNSAPTPSSFPDWALNLKVATR